jgi:hypothetical protein
MLLSDISVKRPVFASVISLLLVIFGLVAFGRLPLREYPDIDPPVVSIDTLYPGAAANVVETQITELIEERIAGVEGIDSHFLQQRGRTLRGDGGVSTPAGMWTGRPTISATGSRPFWTTCPMKPIRRKYRRWTPTTM